MRTLGEPADVSFTPGNHDAYVRDAMPRLAAAFTPWTQSDAEYAHGETFPFVRVRGEVALIGLSTATPTGPLMATGRLGARQIEALAAILQQTGAKDLARVEPAGRHQRSGRRCRAEADQRNLAPHPHDGKVSPRAYSGSPCVHGVNAAARWGIASRT